MGEEVVDEGIQVGSGRDDGPPCPVTFDGNAVKSLIKLLGMRLMKNETEFNRFTAEVKHYRQQRTMLVGIINAIKDQDALSAKKMLNDKVTEDYPPKKIPEPTQDQFLIFLERLRNDPKYTDLFNTLGI